MQEEFSQSNQVNGRWTQQQHQKFLIGLQLFGKNWKKISDFVTTRNGSQIRSHAQKYFMKMSKKKNEGQNGDSYLEDGSSSVSFRSKQNLNKSQENEKVASLNDPYFWNKMFEINMSNQSFSLWDYIDQNGKKIGNEDKVLMKPGSFKYFSYKEKENEVFKPKALNQQKQK